MSRPPRIVISAGEVSGDRLGAGLAGALRELSPDAELIGMGGQRMAAAGVRLVQDAGEVAVVGFSEVLSHLSEIRRAMRRLEAVLEEQRPDVLVPIDFPDFNLRLAARARRAGVPVVYFVSPQVWAWRRRRVHAIRRLVRRMLVLFPFESAFYEQAGVPVTFVGHPLGERGDPARRPPPDPVGLGLDPRRRTVALAPGSRRSEVAHVLPVMLDAARLLDRTHDDLQYLVPIAPGLTESVIREPLARDGNERIHARTGDYAELLSACEAGVVTSGTASLEAAVCGLPIVVVYRMSALSHAIARALVRVEHVAMPNLVAGRRLVPELIQSDCTPQRVAAELARYLDDADHAERVRGELDEVRRRLGGPGVFQRAAREILDEVGTGAGDA